MTEANSGRTHDDESLVQRKFMLSVLEKKRVKGKKKLKGFTNITNRINPVQYSFGPNPTQKVDRPSSTDLVLDPLDQDRAHVMRALLLGNPARMPSSTEERD
ncbi:hypothetical protein GQ457_17G006050 [Hibiscus cannabinus]